MMKQMKLQVLSAILFSIVPLIDVFGCTIVRISKGETTIVGNNEDGVNGTTHLWFLPASKDKYGRVYFTLGDKWPQGGMNDQGLFYDGTSGPAKTIKNSLHKPEYPGNLSEKMLEECASVPEAIDLLQHYNLSYFWNGQMFLADKYGNSAIIEGDTIIISEKNYQIATNYYQSAPGMGGYPCHRYDIVETLARNISSIDMSSMVTIMQATKLDGFSFTQYSTINDLENLNIHYYKDSDFTQYVNIDLNAELLNGERWYETEELFKNKTVLVHKQDLAIQGLDTFIVSYNENGTLKCSLEMSNGVLNGRSIGYYENGKTSWKTVFTNGRIQDDLHFKDTLGINLTGYKYVSDDKVYKYEYYSDGILKTKLTLRKVGNDQIVTAGIVRYNKEGKWKISSAFANIYLWIQYTLAKLFH